MEISEGETWLEVDLDALTHNAGLIRSMMDPEVQLIAALKGNGYGFGLLPLAHHLERLGIRWVAVGQFAHAVALRRSGFTGDILVFGSTVTLPASQIAHSRLMPSLFDVAQAEDLSKNVPGPIEVAVKVDSGLGRLGVLAEEAEEFIKKVRSLPRLSIALVYTHLGDPHRSPNPVARKQVERFSALVGRLRASDFGIRAFQTTSSAGMLVFPEARFNAVCIGRMLFGFSLLRDGAVQTLQPVFRGLKTRLIQVKEVRSGRFGPDRTMIELDRPRRVGIVPCGVADGISPAHASLASALVRGEIVPYVGKTALEHMILDLHNVPEAAVGDEVTIVDGAWEGPVGLRQTATRWQVDVDQIAIRVSPNVRRRYRWRGALYAAEDFLAVASTGARSNA